MAGPETLGLNLLLITIVEQLFKKRDLALRNTFNIMRTYTEGFRLLLGMANARL